ncbi:MAG TPA: GntR family transcriptional regulator [Nitrospinota bacterium]|nr:GntR family transcriptional regulator [Nitrospinota bacterium]
MKIQKKDSDILFPSNTTGGQRVFRSVSLVDQIANTLRDDILTGRFKGGDQLLEDSLKNEFDISRTPLREAFRILEKEGLVEILPRRGTFVKRITKQDIEENFPVRAILEGLAARLAYENLRDQDINEMGEVIEYMEEAAQREDFIDYAKNHIAFHEIFINASGNETLIALLHNLRMHTLWHRYTHHYYKEDFRNSLKVHRRIIDLFKEKKVSEGEIEKVVRQHIEVALGPFLASMEKLEGKTPKKESM